MLAAHSVRGSASAFGLQHLVARAEAVEQTCQIPAMDELLTALEAYLASG